MSVRWIGHVWETSPYEGKTLLLHLALADFANDEGTCFPSQKTLAAKARTTEAWVSRSVRRMVDDGLVEIVERGSGRGNRTIYRLLKPPTQLGDTYKPQTTDTETPNSDTDDTSYRNRKEPSHTLGFDEFWERYPRKVAKVAAKSAFASVMKRPDAPSLDTLLRAVDKYASTGVELRFVAHPATWLRQGRWDDEPQQEPRPASKDWHLERALDRVVPLAHLGRCWDDCLDALRDFDPRVIEPCREVFQQITSRA